MKKIISFQIDELLISKFDEKVQQGSGNRSKALRLMIESILEDNMLIAKIVSTAEVHS